MDLNDEEEEKDDLEGKDAEDARPKKKKTNLKKQMEELKEQVNLQKAHIDSMNTRLTCEEKLLDQVGQMVTRKNVVILPAAKWESKKAYYAMWNAHKRDILSDKRIKTHYSMDWSINLECESDEVKKEVAETIKPILLKNQMKMRVIHADSPTGTMVRKPSQAAHKALQDTLVNAGLDRMKIQTRGATGANRVIFDMLSETETVLIQGCLKQTIVDGPMTMLLKIIDEFKVKGKVIKGEDIDARFWENEHFFREYFLQVDTIVLTKDDEPLLPREELAKSKGKGKGSKDKSSKASDRIK